jgi:hypothetical protein
MYYIKRKRERKSFSGDRPRRRGARMTFMSLAAAAAFMAVMKARNPGLDLKPALLMFAGVALGCFIMAAIGGRAKKDGE